MNSKKQNKREVIGILSLSLILVSTFSVSACLPDMLKFYSSYSRASVEMLVSIPSMVMVVMIAISPVIGKLVHERIIICTGLVLIGVAGVIPVFVTDFSIVMISRILLGTGIGLVNTRAVSLIGERFEGKQKVRLMGIRLSMEGLGQAAMTYIAGLLLVSGWNRAFLVYVAAFFILITYLAFVRDEKTEEEKPTGYGAASDSETESTASARRITAKEWKKILCFVFLNGLAVSTTTVISLRVPNLIVDMNFGSASDGATVLTLSIIAGFAGGMVFGKMMDFLKRHALTFFFAMVVVGLGMIAVCANLVMIAAGAVLCGFFLPSILSYGFHFVSECAPKGALDTVNAATLVGCNLGASLTPLLLSGVDRIHESMVTCFVFYAIVLLALLVMNKLTHMFS